MTSPSSSRAFGPLYVIAAERAMLIDQLVENAGILTPELEARFDALGGAFDERLADEAVAARNLEAEAAKHAAEAERQATRAAVLLQSFTSMKARMKKNMELAGKTEVPKVARIQKNGGLQPVLFSGEAADLPPDFRRVQYSLDGEKVRAAADAGQPLPDGVTIGPRGTQLRILL